MNFSDLPPLKPAGGRALLPLEPWWVPPKTGCRNGEDVYVIGSFFDEPRAALVLIVTSDRIRDEHVAGMELPSVFVRQGEQGLELDLLGMDVDCVIDDMERQGEEWESGTEKLRKLYEDREGGER